MSYLIGTVLGVVLALVIFRAFVKLRIEVECLRSIAEHVRDLTEVRQENVEKLRSLGMVRDQALDRLHQRIDEEVLGVLEHVVVIGRQGEVAQAKLAELVDAVESLDVPKRWRPQSTEFDE